MRKMLALILVAGGLLSAAPKKPKLVVAKCRTTQWDAP
jgi:hypothetical protein